VAAGGVTCFALSLGAHRPFRAGHGSIGAGFAGDRAGAGRQRPRRPGSRSWLNPVSVCWPGVLGGGPSAGTWPAGLPGPPTPAGWPNGALVSRTSASRGSRLPAVVAGALGSRRGWLVIRASAESLCGNGLTSGLGAGARDRPARWAGGGDHGGWCLPDGSGPARASGGARAGGGGPSPGLGRGAIAAGAAGSDRRGGRGRAGVGRLIATIVAVVARGGPRWLLVPSLAVLYFAGHLRGRLDTAGGGWAGWRGAAEDAGGRPRVRCAGPWCGRAPVPGGVSAGRGRSAGSRALVAGDRACWSSPTRPGRHAVGRGGPLIAVRAVTVFGGLRRGRPGSYPRRARRAAGRNLGRTRAGEAGSSPGCGSPLRG